MNLLFPDQMKAFFFFFYICTNEDFSQTLFKQFMFLKTALCFLVLRTINTNILFFLYAINTCIINSCRRNTSAASKNFKLFCLRRKHCFLIYRVYAVVSSGRIILQLFFLMENILWMQNIFSYTKCICVLCLLLAGWNMFQATLIKMK